MWRIYKWNGHYIQGDLVSKHSSEAAAVKKASKVLNVAFTERVQQDRETLIWLDDSNHTPVGVIIKKSRGR